MLSLKISFCYKKVLSSRNSKKTKKLESNILSQKVLNALLPYEKFSFLERYAIFMGKEQLIEMFLKNLLIKSHKYREEDVEKYTLGRVIKELKRVGVRNDFLDLLRQLLKFRNSMAHEMLFINNVMTKVFGDNAQVLNEKEIRYALANVEEVIYVYSFLLNNNYLYT